MYSSNVKGLFPSLGKGTPEGSLLYVVAVVVTYKYSPYTLSQQYAEIFNTQTICINKLFAATSRQPHVVKFEVEMRAEVCLCRL